MQGITQDFDLTTATESPTELEILIAALRIKAATPTPEGLNGIHPIHLMHFDTEFEGSSLRYIYF